MTGERGAALIGALAIGFVVVLAVGQILITVGRLGAASAEAADAASHAAQYGSRHGGPDDAARIARALIPAADVLVTEDGEVLTVEVRITVPLVGPERSPIAKSVTGRATATLSAYRSRP